MHYTHLALPMTPPPSVAPWPPAEGVTDTAPPVSASTLPAWLANSQGDRLFVDMLHAFRPTGGLARESELLASGRLPREAACEAVIRFEWGGVHWLPLFQFLSGEPTLEPTTAQVAAALAPHYDGWRLANWFAQPNTWLGERRPVDVLSDNPARVLEAARVDRFIIEG